MTAVNFGYDAAKITAKILSCLFSMLSAVNPAARGKETLQKERNLWMNITGNIGQTAKWEN